MGLRYLALAVILSFGMAACGQPASDVLPTVSGMPIAPSNTALTTQPSPSLPPLTETQPPSTTTQTTITISPSEISPSATSQNPPLSPEAILILEPGPGSILSSPLDVMGFADSTFEQTLVVNILLDDGTQLFNEPVNIRADVGQRGVFTAEVPFTIGEPRQAFVQVYSVSPRDGGVTHLSSVGVTLSDSGEQKLFQVPSHLEQIAIFKPEPGEEINGGKVLVEGFALAGFEQTLVVEVQDTQGQVVGMQPVIVNAPDLGQPGPFSLELPYQVNGTGPGRVVVRDISPAFGVDVHLSSVEVRLSP